MTVDLTALFGGVDYTTNNPNTDVDKSNDTETPQLDFPTFNYVHDYELHTGRIVEVDAATQTLTVIRLKNNGEDMPAYRETFTRKEVDSMGPRLAEYKRRVGDRPELGAKSPTPRNLTYDEYNATLNKDHKQPATTGSAKNYKRGNYARYVLHDGTEHLGRIDDNDGESGTLSMTKLVGDNLEENGTTHRILYHQVREMTDDEDEAKDLEQGTRVDATIAAKCLADGVVVDIAVKNAKASRHNQGVASLLAGTSTKAGKNFPFKSGDLVQYNTSDNVQRYGRVYSVGAECEVKRSAITDYGDEKPTNIVDRVAPTAMKVVAHFPNAIQALASLLQQYNG